MTTYVINCAPGTDSDDCGLPNDGMTVAQGHSTVVLSYGQDDV